MYKKIACLATGLLLVLVSMGQAGEPLSGPQNETWSGYLPHEILFDAADTIKYTTPLSFCQGGSVVLTANNAPNGATFQWLKNGTNITSATNVSYTATDAGSYSVVVTSGTEIKTYAAVVVTVFPKPLPVFSFNNNICSGSQVHFNSTVTGGTAPYTYEWSFGDNENSANADPSHAFTALGCGTQVFTVTLVVTDANGCSNTISHSVTILRAPDLQIGDQNIFSPFSNCENSPTPQNPNYTITLVNNTVNTTCINNYSINWGDGMVQTNISFPISHTYTELGAFDLVVTASSTNGCKTTRTYVVANQSNPAGSLGTLGSTTGLCAPDSIPFTITNWQLNSPGTSYLLDFGDGTSITMQHPLNPNYTTDTIYHVYTKSSCPSPTFTATLQVINACAITPYTAGNIQISTKPTASFTSPGSVCAGQSICFTNTTAAGHYGTSCLTNTAYDWDFGDGSTHSTNANPCHTYTTPGTYTITLKATNPCGTTVFTKQVCVTTAAIPGFTLSATEGCAPFVVNATNTSNTSSSCVTATYLWSVTYASSNCGTTSGVSFTGGTTASSENPSFSFSTPGTYTIKLSVTNACGTVSTTKTVVVKKPPTVSVNSIANSCGPVTIHPVANVTNCGSGTLSYAWTFGGGSPSTSNSADPGNVTFSAIGDHTISLSVTNECGTTTTSKTFSIKPVPGMAVIGNQTFCPGEATGSFNASGTLPGTIYSWANTNTQIGLSSSGNGATVPSFLAANNGSSVITGTVTVSASNNGCSNNTSFTITVNPKPAAPSVSTPVNYCQGATATALTATASSGNNLLWYSSSSGGTGSATAPTPSTSSIGNTIYYVSQLNPLTGCEGPRSAITVSVKNSPNISNSSFTNPASCNSSTGSITLNGLLAGTSYAVSYTRNGMTQTINLTSNTSGIITISSLSAGTYSNISVSLNGCSSNVVGPFSLSDPNPPATPVANSSGNYCSGSSLQLTASSATNGVSYAWSGPNGFTSVVQNPVINNITVAAGGTYNVVATLNGCTSAAGSVDVTINPSPATPTVSSNSPLCSGNSLNLSATTNITGVSYSWTGPMGFNSTLQNPTINNASISNSGAYTVVATAPAGNCPSLPGTANITVRPTPQINSGTPLDPSSCASSTGSIVLSGLTGNSSYNVKYEKNGVPVSVMISAALNGNLTISGLSSGTYSNIYVILNNCSSNAVGPFTLADPDPPAAPVVESSPVCAGASLQLTATTGTPGTATYSWTGPGGFTSSLQNPVIDKATTSASGTYTVSVTISGCTVNGSVNAIVHPKPLKPAVVRPVLYCLNDNASALVASASSGNNLTWYDNAALNNGSSTAFIPSTSNAGDYNFYVTQTNGSGCISDTSKIPVTVFASVNGNTIGNSQSVCSGNIPSTISSIGNLSGGNGAYTYQWQMSADNGATWTNIAGAVNSNYSPAALFETTWFRRIVNSGPCSNHISNVVVIEVNGTLANYGISAPQTICMGTTPALLNGEAPTGGNGTYIFQWQSSPDNSSWTDIAAATSQDYQPALLSATTYYRRKVISGPCSVFSSTVEITVNPRPVLNSIPSQVYCLNSNVPAINFTANLSGNVSYTWTNDNVNTGIPASGSGPVAAFNALNNTDPKIPLVSNISVLPLYTANGVGCNGDPASFNLTVLPFIAIEPVADTILCTGTTIPSITPVHDGGVYPGSVISYRWNVSGSGISLTTGSGSFIPMFTTFNPGNTDLVASITITPVYSFAGKDCEGQSTDFTVTVKPATPASNAGPDVVLCASESYLMNAASIPGTNGIWTQISGSPALIANPSSGTTLITGLQQGQTYKFEWTVTGFANCPPTKDTVTIKVDAQLINDIDTSPQTICYGQDVTVNGLPPSGGSGTYIYQWQSSADGINWTDLPGFTSSNITFTPAASIYVRRKVSSLPCENESVQVLITVQPPVSNNTISADHTICINTAAQLLIGSNPSGANGTFLYQWQRSIDGITWTDIQGAINIDYDPGILDLTTTFRRIVYSNLCSGPQSSTSNIVTITVNPDAKAKFVSIKDSSCAPFLIDESIIQLQPFPDRNTSYQWYANGNHVGDGNPFPGYSLIESGDSISIKLVAISSFGCRNDSIEHKFYTYKEPDPSFILGDTVGCGPLTVLVNNTTPDAGLFQYHWDFGNGQSSTQEQPGAVVFQPNPTFGDTTYVVILTVTSGCHTYVLKDSVRVKSKPKALFTPDHSVGCSPMTVTFNNTSAGIGNSYQWNFGDGSPLVNTATAAPVSHTFYTGVQDTFHVKLMATNECGSDTLAYAIVVSPNQIALDFAINGNQFSGCSPHTVQFINNSNGASLFTWNFGDNNIISTTDNIDTVSHTYLIPGNYTVTLTATNGCSDTTTTEQIIIYPKPEAGFHADASAVCIGKDVSFTNQSTGATSYLWNFGDGNISALTSPQHSYASPGLYTVKLITYSFNAPGTVCIDSAEQNINVVSLLSGSFTASEDQGYCAPFTVQFTNPHLPSVTAVWDFGDGQTGTGDQISHTYTQAGDYLVSLIVTVPGGCTYSSTKNIKVSGPKGTWTHSTGYLCQDQQAVFQVNASNADSYIYHFGDGSIVTSTSNVMHHSYLNPGIFFPRVILSNNAGCEVELEGLDSIRVDRIVAGFTSTQQTHCGFTEVNFRDTSFAFFGKADVNWNFGDGHTATGQAISHQYQASGIYPVQLIIKGNSGCTDTIMIPVNIHVNNLPVAEIIAEAETCQGYKIHFNSNIQSTDGINFIQWNISNGVSNNKAAFSYSFSQTGDYTIRLVTGTINGCYDTAYHQIKVKPSPTIHAGNDLLICLGSSAPLMATGNGVVKYNWSPLQGLNCYDCQDPVASPVQTTPYLVQGTNSVGCSAYDTVVVTVIQPLHLNVSAADSICIGSSTNLLVSGGTVYSWSPAAGLSNTSISNPTASPLTTTTYRVVGYDGYNCFTDTAFITVAVGEYPIVNLGPDLILATGTLHPLQTVIQNGPISKWNWSPSTDLSCNDCPLPVAHIKKDIAYQVMVTTPYGCSASDSIQIKTFCESAQVFVPNAFTPNGDGNNDVLMVRASGVAMVKSFRIFNRWGELVFEKANCIPNDPQYGWDGRIKGITGGPDVYVYTAEVICENGSSYTYKGNVTILK